MTAMHCTRCGFRWLTEMPPEMPRHLHTDCCHHCVGKSPSWPRIEKKAVAQVIAIADNMKFEDHPDAK